MGDNGEKVKGTKLSLDEFMVQLNSFMKNTNELLAALMLAQKNQQVDIDKLKKKLRDKEFLVRV